VTGRLAARAADAQALLAQFNEVSKSAIEALGRGDTDALAQALDVRDGLQHEIERALREIMSVRTRFAGASSAYGVPRVIDTAVERYCAPLEELARVAEELQQRLARTASELRDEIVGELAHLEVGAGATARYASSAVAELHLPDTRRLDVTL
jgi:hypothetical protein